MKAVIAGVLAVAALTAAAPAYAAPAHQFRGTTRLCRPNAKRIVRNWTGQRLIIRNDVWGPGDRQCITGRNGWANFTVTTSTPTGGMVGGFPYILDGCAWGACSPDSALPIRAGHIARLAVSVHTRGIGTPGRYNAAFDLWFMHRPSHSGQAHGAEVMIWLATRGYRGVAGWPTVRVDGVEWGVNTGHPCNPMGCWNRVIYRRVHMTTHVRGLLLAPFLRDAIRRRLLSRRDWLTAVPFGFEIQAGGTRLAVTSCRVWRQS